MSIENLDSLFRPSSVALIGASRTPGSVGAVLARNLLTSGFEGPVLPVHPEHRSVRGTLAYPDIGSLPLTPELGIVATPPRTVPGIVRELGERGAKAAIVISAGFAEVGDEEGAERQHQMVEAARDHGLRLLGPNCLGLLVPGSGLNASFSHLPAIEGDLAFVAQSGAVVTGVLDWATPHGIGFSHMVSLGNVADIDFGDVIDYLALDTSTRAILLYIESVTDARKFLSAARAAARSKPVIAVKGGRQGASAEAATSHTGAMAGSSAVYSAAFRRAGILEARDMEDLFEAVEILRTPLSARGDRVAILTNGGGFGVVATDGLVERGGRLAELSSTTLRKLSDALPTGWSRGNPVDIVGDAPPERYGKALEILLEASELDAILVIHAPTAVTSSTDSARAVAESSRTGKKVVVASWIGRQAVAEGRRILAENSIPCYTTPAQAIEGLLQRFSIHRSQELLLETPPPLPEPFSPDRVSVRERVDAALEDGRSWLDQAESKSVLRAYDVPVIDTRVAADAEEVAEAAADLGGPVALKILSADVTHKADVGGVRLDIETPEDARRAAEGMLERIGEEQPDARIRGFTVEPMQRRSGAFELIVGMVDDPLFGPAILFGQGGAAVEVIDDRALALPPLDVKRARDLIERTRVHRLLLGYRDRPGVDLDAIAATLVKVSRLVCDVVEIAELDINPLLADSSGALAVDARIRVAAAEGRNPAARLAVRPYPKELQEDIALEGGPTLRLRPIRPEDEPRFRDLVERLPPDQARGRFFAARSGIDHRTAARLTRADWDRELALVVADPGAPGESPIHGEARLSAGPTRSSAEMALLVEPELQGRGLGGRLARRILELAGEWGVDEVWADTLVDNEPMVRLCRALDFERKPHDDRRGVVRFVKRLQ